MKIRLIFSFMTNLKTKLFFACLVRRSDYCNWDFFDFFNVWFNFGEEILINLIELWNLQCKKGFCDLLIYDFWTSPDLLTEFVWFFSFKTRSRNKIFGPHKHHVIFEWPPKLLVSCIIDYSWFCFRGHIWRTTRNSNSSYRIWTGNFQLAIN